METIKKEEAMTLEEKCQEHWSRLGLTNLDALKDHIRSLFEKHDTQAGVLEEIYRLALPEWDIIEKVHGYPEAGEEFWQFVCRLFMDFDREHHPSVMPGGAWMNKGFSVNRELDPWEIILSNCNVDYKGGQDVEHPEQREIGSDTPAL
ncbi:MAG: hypothetical protein ABIM40_09800 [Pseudomonadota bacterium]